MVKHTSATTARDINNPSTRTDQVSVSRSTNQIRPQADDVILSLANAYENKRARQVTEWERTQATRWHRAA
ncbi:MAG: hypothetical protein ABIR33_09035 [Pyrinomonadaceae bacterium]